MVATLANNPLFSSFCIHGSNKRPYHITMKPQKKLYDQILIEEGSIASVEELQRLAMEYPHRKHSTFPGPLFHALIYYIEDIKSAGLVYYGKFQNQSRGDRSVAHVYSTPHCA